MTPGTLGPSQWGAPFLKVASFSERKAPHLNFSKLFYVTFSLAARKERVSSRRSFIIMGARVVMSDENYSFRWSNFYRACLVILFILPFIDIFLQALLENWVWVIVSVVFSVLILAMIVASFKRPFITLRDGVMRFYLIPIAPIIFQSFRLNDIASVLVKNSSIRIILSNGRKARANLYARDPSDRETLMEIYQDMGIAEI